MITRFSVPKLYDCTKVLAKTASNILPPALVLFNARILSTYTDRIIKDKEIWISKGRIACVKDSGSAKKIFKNDQFLSYNVKNYILAPGLIDPHMHIESSMMTGCAYAEAALLNGTTTIFWNVSSIYSIGEKCNSSP